MVLNKFPFASYCVSFLGGLFNLFMFSTFSSVEFLPRREPSPVTGTPARGTLRSCWISSFGVGDLRSGALSPICSDVSVLCLFSLSCRFGFLCLPYYVDDRGHVSGRMDGEV